MSETKISEPPVAERKIVEPQIAVITEPRVLKIENRFEEPTANQKILPLRENMLPQIAENHFEELTANQTRILPAQEKSVRRIVDIAQAAPVPVINVTIGRVEVRAAVSSAPVRETRPKPPTLSLDEYLRQRRGGGER